MSRRYAPVTEGELDRLLLIAPPTTNVVSTDEKLVAPPPVDAPIARLHWGEADPGDEDPGDEDDHARSQDRGVALFFAGAVDAHGAHAIGRDWPRAAARGKK